MPTARALVALEAAGGRVYAIGGGSEPGAGLSAVEVYDAATDEWTTGSPLPTARSSPCSAVLDGKIHDIGGASGGRSGTIHGANTAYGPVADSWTAAADMQTPRAGLTCAAVEGATYAIGGVLAWPSPPPGVDTVERFRPVAS
jgi:hypothetical protein